MTGKRSKRLNSALVSVGMVALVAGCGGGGAVSNSNGTTTYIPPAGKQMGTATLSLLVPGRRPASGNRTPRYVSPFTTRVDVSAVSAGAPSPWPVATSTSIPTPGPVPSGATPSPIPVTVQVPVPLGNAQFGVNTYDGGGYLLSGIVSPVTSVVPNSPNNINLVLNAAADCVQINGTAGGNFVMTPMVHQAATQSATFVVTPCDADGYPIPAGTLANAITFATPAPVNISVNSNRRSPKFAPPTPPPTPGPAVLTFSPSVITQGGPTTVTVTYPTNNNAVLSAQAVPSPMPSAISGGMPNITADPVFLALVPNHDDGSVSVFAKDMQGTSPLHFLGTENLPGALYPSAIVAGGAGQGCAAAGQALIGSSGSIYVLTEPVPSQANPTPTPAVSVLTSSNGGVAAALDDSCNAYVGDASGYMYTASAQMSVIGQSGGTYPTNVSPPAAISAAAWLGGVTYVGLGATSGYLNNIVTLAGVDQKAGSGTVAMARYDAGSLVIAYQLMPGGTYYLAQVSPSGASLSSGIPVDTKSVQTVRGMTVDGAGNVWVVNGTNAIYEYNPNSALFAPYSLPAPNYNASAVVAAPDGTLFITDNGSSPGKLYSYSWKNITGGVGTTPVAISAPQNTGIGPAGVAIAP